MVFFTDEILSEFSSNLYGRRVRNDAESKRPKDSSIVRKHIQLLFLLSDKMSEMFIRLLKRPRVGPTDPNCAFMNLLTKKFLLKTFEDK